MTTIIGLLITYAGFGLVLFGIRENYNLSTVLNDLISAAGVSTGDKIIIVGVIVIAAGTVVILANANWKKKKRY